MRKTKNNFIYKFILDKRTKNINNHYKIKINLYSRILKKNRILSIKELGKKDLIDQSSFNKILSSADIKFNNNKLNRIKNLIDSLDRNLKFIVSRTDIYSFSQVKNLIKEKQIESKTIIDLLYFLNKISKNHLQKGNYNLGKSFNSTISVLKDFSNSKKILFLEINKEWLESLEKYMVYNSFKKNTIIKYMSNIRFAFNSAIREKHIPSESYPFGNNQYVVKKIQKSLSIKLSYKDFEKLMSCDLKDKDLILCRDIFIFSFFSKGIPLKQLIMLKKTQFNLNTSDFEKLRFSHLKKNKCWFTYKDKKQEKKILINKPMFEIIKKYIGSNNLIFNILDNKYSTKDSIKIENFLKKFNVSLKRIADSIDLPKEISQTWSKKYYELFIEKKYNEWIMNL